MHGESHGNSWSLYFLCGECAEKEASSCPSVDKEEGKSYASYLAPELQQVVGVDSQRTYILETKMLHNYA